MNTILIFNLSNGKEVKVTFEGDIKKNKQLLFDIVESVNKDKFIFVESNIVEDFYIIKTDDIVNINVDVDYRTNGYTIKSPLDQGEYVFIWQMSNLKVENDLKNSFENLKNVYLCEKGCKY